MEGTLDNLGKAEGGEPVSVGGKSVGAYLRSMHDNCDHKIGTVSMRNTHTDQ